MKGRQQWVPTGIGSEGMGADAGQPAEDGGSRPRSRRAVVRASQVFGAVVVAAALAACGGGSSGGGSGGGGSGSGGSGGSGDTGGGNAGGGGTGGGGTGGGTVTTCDSIAGGGTGYALGVCDATRTAQFQPIEGTVLPVDSPSSYTLDLTFPASLPADLSTSLVFTESDRTTVNPSRPQDVIGVLRGAAYEKPLGENPPYTALTSFRTVWSIDQPPKTLYTFTYSSFGIWEKYGARIQQGNYIGPWYHASTSIPSVNTWPTGARTYEGWAVGVLGPYHPARDTGRGELAYIYGFSGKVSISVGPDGRIVPTANALSEVRASWPASTASGIDSDPVSFGDVAIQQTPGDSLNGPVSATLSGVSESTFEAQYFGTQTSPAQEIAGRFRFKTADGVLVTGAFGARPVQ